MEDQQPISVDLNPISLPIPGCLLRCDVINEDPTPVTLPPKFLRVSRDWTEEEPQDSTESRGRDILSALEWVRQQMVILRKDDIKLLRRFLDLHATMMELKWVYESANSVSDASSYNGSNMSLDDVMNAPRNCCLTSDEQDTQFRERTTSLLIPRKSRVTRIRWKSNEIIWSIIISLS